MTNQTRSAPAATDTTISIEDLRTVFDDRLISPTDAAYDEARTVFYGGIDRRPALIVRARNATDASRAVRLARNSGLELAVRSGGHSIAGHGVSDGGIVLDLSSGSATWCASTGSR